MYLIFWITRMGKSVNIFWNYFYSILCTIFSFIRWSLTRYFFHVKCSKDFYPQDETGPSSGWQLPPTGMRHWKSGTGWEVCGLISSLPQAAFTFQRVNRPWGRAAGDSSLLLNVVTHRLGAAANRPLPEPRSQVFKRSSSSACTIPALGLWGVSELEVL